MPATTKTDFQSSVLCVSRRPCGLDNDDNDNDRCNDDADADSILRGVIDILLKSFVLRCGCRPVLDMFDFFKY